MTASLATEKDGEDILFLALNSAVFVEEADKHLQLEPHDMAPFFEWLVEKTYEGYSRVYRNERGLLVGFRLGDIRHRGVPEPGPASRNPKLAKVERALEELDAKVWELLPDTKTLYCFDYTFFAPSTFGSSRGKRLQHTSTWDSSRTSSPKRRS